LAVLKGFVLGIEAEYYLQRHLTLHKEALVPALGGAPFALRTHIEDELDKLAAEGATPLFVFSGMGIVNKNATDTALDESNQINARGWELYDRGEADNIVATFERSGESIGSSDRSRSEISQNPSNQSTIIGFCKSFSSNESSSLW
jgi:hypothetical protein